MTRVGGGVQTLPKKDDIICEQPLTGVKENPFVSKVWKDDGNFYCLLFAVTRMLMVAHAYREYSCLIMFAG